MQLFNKWIRKLKNKKYEKEQEKIEQQLILKQLPIFLSNIKTNYDEKPNLSLQEIVKEVIETTDEPLKSNCLSLIS
jgi:predicted transcriptional regulator